MALRQIGVNGVNGQIWENVNLQGFIRREHDQEPAMTKPKTDTAKVA